MVDQGEQGDAMILFPLAIKLSLHGHVEMLILTHVVMRSNRIKHDDAWVLIVIPIQRKELKLSLQKTMKLISINLVQMST